LPAQSYYLEVRSFG